MHFSQRFWNIVDDYVRACGGDPETFPSCDSDADRKMLDALRQEIIELAKNAVVTALEQLKER